MHRLLAVPFAALAAPALAHPGHLAESAGHTHWIALAAFGGASAIVVIGIARAALRRKRERTASGAE
jgi:hypothetical protein